MTIDISNVVKADEFWKTVAATIGTIALGVFAWLGGTFVSEVEGIRKNVGDLSVASASQTVAMQNLSTITTRTQDVVARVLVQQREDEQKSADLGVKAASMDAKLNAFMNDFGWMMKGSDKNNAR